MIDIHFYMKIHELNQELLKGGKPDKEYVIRKFSEFRSTEPVVYNIETTNACNMSCKMCPRTTMMTRSVETIKKDNFIQIVDQLRPWDKTEWDQWKQFVLKNCLFSKIYGLIPVREGPPLYEIKLS